MQFVENYKNREFALSFKDWHTGSFKSGYDFLESLMGTEPVTDVGDGPLIAGKGLSVVFLDLGRSVSQLLEITALTSA